MGQDTVGRRHVKAIFDEALQRPPAERATFLDSACAGEPEVRARVERLLSMIADDPAFLEEPPLTTDFGVEDLTNLDRDDDLTGKRLSHYDLRRVIATGGMGTVYEAVQEKPHRTVAVKVMKRGIASRSALRRFEYESQILARLRHPGIAQIYEAGMHKENGGSGVPYFAMEYIAGAKDVIEYCQAKDLRTRERLELFCKICDAIHHGHQKGSIHRDLKPANILIDSFGQPKIIDFGVARATDSDMAITTLQTDVGQLIGTVQYMSPEQIDADPHDIDTRSDVYALGVVLYKTVTDELPFGTMGLAAQHQFRLRRRRRRYHVHGGVALKARFPLWPRQGRRRGGRPGAGKFSQLPPGDRVRHVAAPAHRLAGQRLRLSRRHR